MGGSKENRHTPGLEHWSIAVKDGKALEKQWRTETPIPRGGPHRSGDCLSLYNSVWTLEKHSFHSSFMKGKMSSFLIFSFIAD